MAQNLTLNIVIAPGDLKDLREKHLNLCLSRDVQFKGELKPGNVVFYGVPSQDLGPNITLEWQEKYQVFGTTRFEAGEKVTVDTKVQDIEGGQKATLKKDGTTGLSGSPQPGIPFDVDNEWKAQAFIGVSNYNNDRTTSFFFVSPEVSEPSTSQLLPMEVYSVFWDAKLETGLMFDISSVDRFLFAFPPGMTAATLMYKDKEWVINSK